MAQVTDKTEYGPCEMEDGERRIVLIERKSENGTFGCRFGRNHGDTFPLPSSMTTSLSLSLFFPISVPSLPNLY